MCPHDFQKRVPVPVQLYLTHSRDPSQRISIGGAGAGHRGERRIVEDHVRGHGLIPSQLEPESSETVE